MAWDPGIYNKFKSERSVPFYDLLSLVKEKPGMNVIDLGCGTGELTRVLADRLAGAAVLGIDSSAEMLSGSKNFSGKTVRFEHRSIEDQLALGTKWDLIFSNAALQWTEDHETLLPEIISHLMPGGQLAIQVPAQHHNRSNLLLNEMAGEEPFQSALKNWKNISPVLAIEHYARLLFENGCKEMTVFEKIYPLVLKDADGLYEWVSGTALRPFTEKLPDEALHLFCSEFKTRLQNLFPGSPVFYPFKRILLAAEF